jgi:maleate cis-trans isomerase
MRAPGVCSCTTATLRTLETARKRAPRKIAQANQALVYYSINLSCVFGGKRYHSKSHGKRPHQSTIKQDCEAVIKLSLSDDGQSLVVTEEI